MRSPNPFKPRFGEKPPVFIDRDEVLYDFEDGLAAGVGAPGRFMRVEGPLGSGRTVLLGLLAERANACGWGALVETCGPELPARVAERLGATGPVALLGDGSKEEQRGGEVQPASDLAAYMDEMVQHCMEAGGGLLFAIDDARAEDAEALVPVIEAARQLMRRGQEVALVVAGLPEDLDSLDRQGLLSGSFLERLDDIPVDEVASSLDDVVRRNNMAFDPEALAITAKATAGRPYLIQLIGYYAWRAVQLGDNLWGTIGVKEVQRAIADAARAVGRDEVEPLLGELSLQELEYLLAMTRDQLASSAADLAKRMGMTSSVLRHIRRKLCGMHLIEPTVTGYLKFSQPLVREYLTGNRSRLLARYGVEG